MRPSRSGGACGVGSRLRLEQMMPDPALHDADQADASIMRAALAPIIWEAALVLPVTIVGITELSHTRKPVTP